MRAYSSEVHKNLLILQLEGIKRLVNEFHQQTEAYVQQFGYLPLSKEPAEAAHNARIALRSLASASPSIAEGCAVSEIIRDATQKHCGVDMCATSPENLEHFLAISRNDVKTAEDRVHALFVLDATLTSARHRKEMQSRFEGLQGYEVLVEWLAVSCSYNDETSKAFTELLLLVLHRNLPTALFTTKTVVKNLSTYKKVMKAFSP
ncbi:uncharacterized protein PHALS_12013 [Plasmopara halstedii]|uniref:Uncharacterized protein n=1 Tax=Plasmopara halstedii TaxID=4781 RepID=A0A0P1ALA6_PLAHL|nr:uncharacterized protein PHALS_12013 [Plasmopara halstedii]CEG41677.1 hypothetical protein PHALS_12013 [Plasmopara halstedii]|eukprot:XP_024578046.1 hypothetical protein PHALS_12013 [Plasmopara halstedii]